MMKYLILLVALSSASRADIPFRLNPMGQSTTIGYPNVTYGLVGWWKLDENAANTTVADSAGSNTGTAFYNTAGTSVDGKCGRAMYCLGNTYSGTNVNINYSATLNPKTNNWTLTSWFKLSKKSSYDPYIWCQYDTAGNAVILIRASTTGAMIFYSRDTTGSVAITVTSAATYNDAAWHHLAWVKSGKTGIAYIDGTEVGRNTNNSLGSVDLTSTHKMAIGCWWFNNTVPWYGWNGWIDDMRVYNRALDASEVTTVYNWRP